MIFENIFDSDFISKNNLDKFKGKNISKLARNTAEIDDGSIFFCLTSDFQKAKERCDEAYSKGVMLAISNFSGVGLQVEDVRELFAKSCANFYERACDDLTIVGVTGTNGKTTTTHIISEILKRNGKSVGVIGTNGVSYNGRTFECPLTTPDADFLHKTFFDMRNAGVEFVIMEVSAHAIDQKRIAGINFEIGVLTNITQDHLDYFKTMDNYQRTKLSFFTSKHIKRGVVCVDDERARQVLKFSDVPISTYGITNPADCFSIDACYSMSGTSFIANVCDSVMAIKTNLIGDYNVYNALAGLCVCQELGIDDKNLARGLSFVNPVEGRFNVSKIGGKYVVIDFAHSPDGLMNVLKTARKLTDKSVNVVFGCGGNRDRSKRAQMGKIAEEYADYVCLTDDNPRLEKSEDIVADIEEGMTRPHMVETDRKKAIKKMIDFSKPGDILIIAGKGAEKYQEVGTEKRPYNDFDTVYECFKQSSPFHKENKGDYYGGC